MQLSKKAQWKIERDRWVEERRLLMRSMREAIEEADDAGRPYSRVKIRANGIIAWRGANLHSDPIRPDNERAPVET
jgi:hypothetical protein